MRLNKLFVILFIMLICLTTYVYAETPEITASSGVVIDCFDGKILYEKNMNDKMYPASLTKVLTAILVVENSNMSDEVVVSQKAISNVEFGYLTANIKEGEILTVDQLLNLLLISSYNDVANVLAEHIGGTQENFVDMMNKKAKDIGCTNSNFVNCNGTHNVEHYSTAHDMALIGKYAMQYDEIKEIVKKIYYELGATNKYDRDDRLYQTTNEMLLSGSSNYYKYAYGVKTGFTTPAGNCLMAFSVKNDIPLVSVVMKSTTSDSKYEDSRAILEYAYDNNVLRNLVREGTTVQTTIVKKGSSDTKKLNVVLEKDINAVVNIENENKNISPDIEISNNLKAPISKGEVVGKIKYEIEGKTYEANLIAENDVKKSKTFMIFMIIFIGLILLLGSIRIRGIAKRNKTLNKIRGIKK